MKSIIAYSIVLIFCLTACKSTIYSGMDSKDAATLLLRQAVEAHGGQRYMEAHYEFVFRNNKYSFKNSQNAYHYTVNKVKKEKQVLDVLTNEDFSRAIDGEQLTLTEADKKRYGAALNSVIYFATLPYKLLDPAVNLVYKGTTRVKGQPYKVLQVSFDKEGGGVDHDDLYHYWINEETKLIDYLAYNYKVNKGGVRFRTAYNTRRVEGIVFQDYINYKAPVGTPLDQLPLLYEQDRLDKLSVIATEQVKKL